MTDVFASGTPQSGANDLVGEGKKFKTVDDLAKGKVEADAFIEKLTRELAEVREVANKNINAEQQLEALKNELKSLRDAGGQARENTTPALSGRDIEALVERSITQKEASKTASQNLAESNAKTVEHFGTLEAAKKAVETKAVELGVTVEYLRETAAKSPTAFAHLIGLDGKQAPGSPGSFIQPSRAAPTKEGTPENLIPGTYAYAENVRRTKPAEYWSKGFQQKHVWEAAKKGTYKIPGTNP